MQEANPPVPWNWFVVRRSRFVASGYAVRAELYINSDWVLHCPAWRCFRLPPMYIHAGVRSITQDFVSWTHMPTSYCLYAWSSAFPFARMCFACLSSNCIFFYKFRLKRKIPALPSWCPNWKQNHLRGAGEFAVRGRAWIKRSTIKTTHPVALFPKHKWPPSDRSLGYRKWVEYNLIHCVGQCLPVWGVPFSLPCLVLVGKEISHLVAFSAEGSSK